MPDAPTSLTFNNCTLCSHCIDVFCIYLRTNSELCHLQHKLIGFYNRDEKCLQRGTDWAFNLLTPNVNYSSRTAPLTSKVAFYIFIQQIYVLNILNMVYTLRFFSSKYSLFHNSNVFGSCIIHILYTECAKIKNNNSGAKRLNKAVCASPLNG